MIRSIKTIRALNILLAVTLMTAASACHRRPLYDPPIYIELEVTLNTENVRNVTSDIYNNSLEKPGLDSEMLRALFYDPETGKLAAQAFLSESSVNELGQTVLFGEVRINPGSYDVLIYNFDIDDTSVSGEKYINEILATTTMIPQYILDILNFKSGEDLPLYYQPQHLFVSRSHIEVTDTPLIVQKFECEANSVVNTYYLQVRAEGLEYTQLAMASVSGVSSSNHFQTDEADIDAECQVYMELDGGIDPTNSDKEVLCCLFNTFGRIDDTNATLSIRFDIISTDGTKYIKTLDLRPTFESQDCIDHNWLIMDYVLSIPPTAGDGDSGSFAPEIGDWDEIYGDIFTRSITRAAIAERVRLNN